MFDYILAIDPSGNFNEGKGETGYALFKCYPEIINNSIGHFILTGTFKASNYTTSIDYWHSILLAIEQWQKECPNLCVVIEDYILYQNKATAQINSRMETAQLLGVFKYHLTTLNIPYYLQFAAEVKKRWNDVVLEYKGYIQKKGKKSFLENSVTPINEHAKDAMRHALHFAHFKNKEK